MRNYLTRRNNDLSFNRFFEDAFDDFFKPVFYGVRECSMKTDIKEKENEYELMVDMPGFDKKDIALSLNNGYLTLEARREEKEDNEEIKEIKDTKEEVSKAEKKIAKDEQSRH